VIICKTKRIEKNRAKRLAVSRVALFAYSIGVSCEFVSIDILGNLPFFFK